MRVEYLKRGAVMRKLSNHLKNWSFFIAGLSLVLSVMVISQDSLAMGKKVAQDKDAEARAKFYSSSKERHYESRQGRLEYQQTLLNDRFVNSGVYYHR